jgi:hypothetical protein
MRPMHQIGEGLEVALVAAQAHQFVAAAVFFEVGGEGDLDVDVIVRREGIGDDRKRRALAAEVVIE